MEENNKYIKCDIGIYHDSHGGHKIMVINDYRVYGGKCVETMPDVVIKNCCINKEEFIEDIKTALEMN